MRHLRGPPITRHRQVSCLLSVTAVVNSDLIFELVLYKPYWHTCCDRQQEMQSLLKRAMLPCCAWSDHSTEYLLRDTVELHKRKTLEWAGCRVFGRLSRSLSVCVCGDWGPAAGCNASLSNVLFKLALGHAADGGKGRRCSLFGSFHTCNRDALMLESNKEGAT